MRKDKLNERAARLKTEVPAVVALIVLAFVL